jgi:hypothetical protein
MMALKIHELFLRDPKQDGLANGGQARIRNERSVQAENELRAELSSFVCDGQYGHAMQRILAEYQKHLNRDRQVAAWISGFYGSGKSHLLKMFGHLWQNTEFSDGSTARDLVVGLPEEVRAQLKELDQTAKRLGVPRFAAMGQLPAGSGEFVRATIASIVLEACSLPAQVQLAEFVFWLREHKIEEQVRKEVEAAGKPWLSELSALYVSPLIARAVINAMPSFAASEADARRAFSAQFAPLKSDIDSKRFIKVIRHALGDGAKLPLAVIVLDEIQQYIADSSQRAADVTEAIEALYTQLDSRVLVIGAGQSALSTNTPTLVKLRDRFFVTVQLSDSDVEAVTRKVVLAKKPAHEATIRATIDSHSGELARHLKASPKLSIRADDAKILVTDYPLLPTRRRFWEECFRAVDAQGTHSQLRSQLKVLHQAVLDFADRPIGHVIPADALYSAIADKLVNTGVLLPELYNRIEKLAGSGSAKDSLRRRVCGLVFLIMKLPRETGIDLGVRATAEVIADLMVEDLTVPSASLRNDVLTALEGLVADGTLMKVNDEYRLQTTEGAEWDRAFKERVTQLNAQPEEIEAIRAQRFREQAQSAASEVKIKQGASKVMRSVSLHYDGTAPTTNDGLAIWMRDGWSASEKDVLDAARAGGIDDPTIYVFVPKKEADALRRHLIESVAAQRTLDNKGVPANREGEEAKSSIASRKMVAENAAREAIKDIFRSARVFQGGGNELTFTSLPEALQTAAQAAVSRRYPRFGEADSAQWETVIQRAKSGADASFTPVGHTGAVEDHPVSREVLRVMGTGATGNKIRKELSAAPFGWPNDAIDAALIAMHRSGFIRATRNGNALATGQLDQSSVPTAEFKREQIVVTTMQKIAVRGVCTHCKCNAKAGEEEAKAIEAIRALDAKAKSAGGLSPAPEAPSLAILSELSTKSGAELLVAIADHAEAIKQFWDHCEKVAAQVAQRRPQWDRVKRLSAHAKSLPELADAIAQLDAVEQNRSLLADPDPVAPIGKQIAAALRAKLQSAYEAHAAQVAEAGATLHADPSWARLSAEQQTAILDANGLLQPSKPVVGTDDELIAALDATSLEARGHLATVAKAGVAKALGEAVKLLAPKARQIPIRPATLSTESEVEAWVSARKTELLEAIKQGPVILG